MRGDRYIETHARCSCGRMVVAVPGLAAVVCPHEPPAFTAPVAGRGRSELAATGQTLAAAFALLTRPCSACSCSRQLIGEFDPDPDCPGLSRDADGCRADARIRAWSLMAEAGMEYRSSSMRSERQAIGLALEHVVTVLTNADQRDDVVDRARGRGDVVTAPRVEPVLTLREKGLTFPQIAAELGYASASGALKAHERAARRAATRRSTSPAGAGRLTA